jgi:hypothetical protein
MLNLTTISDRHVNGVARYLPPFFLKNPRNHQIVFLSLLALSTTLSLIGKKVHIDAQFVAEQIIEFIFYFFRGAVPYM